VDRVNCNGRSLGWHGSQGRMERGRRCRTKTLPNRDPNMGVVVGDGLPWRGGGFADRLTLHHQRHLPLRPQMTTIAIEIAYSFRIHPLHLPRLRNQPPCPDGTNGVANSSTVQWVRRALRPEGNTEVVHPVPRRKRGVEDTHCAVTARDLCPSPAQRRRLHTWLATRTATQGLQSNYTSQAVCIP
jgi:hypothetical protein